MTSRILKQYRFCKRHENDSTLSDSEKQANKQLVDEVQQYVSSIDDSMIRRAIRMRYMEGNYTPKWDKIANKIGGENTADGIRMAVKRYLRKH